MTKLALEILGPDAALGEDNAPYGGYWQYQQLRSRGNTIEAGTSEVLRNIVAERVLGLPTHARAMDFTFTPEQDALREQAREFLAANPEPTWAQLPSSAGRASRSRRRTAAPGSRSSRRPFSSRSSDARSTAVRTSRRSG